MWNKSDLLDHQERANRKATSDRNENVVLVSSLTGDGLPQLLEKIEHRLSQSSTLYDIVLQASDGQGMAWLHQRGEVLERKVFEDGRTQLTVRMEEGTAGQATAKFGKAISTRK